MYLLTFFLHITISFYNMPLYNVRRYYFFNNVTSINYSYSIILENIIMYLHTLFLVPNLRLFSIQFEIPFFQIIVWQPKINFNNMYCRYCWTVFNFWHVSLFIFDPWAWQILWAPPSLYFLRIRLNFVRPVMRNWFFTSFLLFEILDPLNLMT